MLGNTFSPYQRSSRMIRRLAEINLVTGDSAAALKYLRILSKTLFHRKWAESQVKMIQSSETNKWLAGKRSQVSDADLLRKSNDYLSSLQFLVEQHPDNLVAVDYLLCYLLLNKEVKLFRENYDRYYLKLNRPVPKVYAEALLIQLVADRASQQEAQSYFINPEIVTRFTEYTRIFEQTSGDMNALSKQFSKSYWFYYHFATIQKK
jgi:ATP/maltotriose-dependent transcriptional regulator MalT